MALPTHVQSSGWVNDVSDVVTLSLTGVGTGNAVLVGIAQSSTTARTFTVVNSAEGNTFTQRQRLAPNRVAEIWATYNVTTTAGAVTIVITASGTSTFAALAVEVGNLGTAVDPFDVANQLDNATTVNSHLSAPVGEIDTAVDVYCFAVSAIVNTSGGASAGASWNTLDEPPVGVNGFAQYRISATALTDERGPFSTVTARESRAVIASFKAPAAAGGHPAIRRFGVTEYTASEAPRGHKGVQIMEQRRAWGRRRSGIVVPAPYQEAA